MCLSVVHCQCCSQGQPKRKLLAIPCNRGVFHTEETQLKNSTTYLPITQVKQNNCFLSIYTYNNIRLSGMPLVLDIGLSPCDWQSKVQWPVLVKYSKVLISYANIFLSGLLKCCPGHPPLAQVVHHFAKLNEIPGIYLQS